MTVRADSEAGFQQQVEYLAQLHGWRIFHAPDNRPIKLRSGRVIKQNVRPGFPDLVLLRPPELIFAELKTDTGRISPAQREWLNELGQVSDAIATLAVEAYGAARLEFGPTPPGLPSVHGFVWRPRDLEVIQLTLARRV
jgi:hypothetical protein